MEIHALAARGWTVVGDRPAHRPQDIRKYLRRRARAPPADGKLLETGARVSDRRFQDDWDVSAVALFDELVAASFDRSPPTLVREMRRLELRPVCLVCPRRRRPRADDGD